MRRHQPVSRGSSSVIIHSLFSVRTHSLVSSPSWHAPHVYARTKQRSEVNHVFSSAAPPSIHPPVFMCVRADRGLSAVWGALLSSLADPDCTHTVNKHSPSPADSLYLSSSPGDFSFFFWNLKCLPALVNLMETKCLKYNVRSNKGCITELFCHVISMWDLGSTFTSLQEGWKAWFLEWNPPRMCPKSEGGRSTSTEKNVVQSQRVLKTHR